MQDATITSEDYKPNYDLNSRDQEEILNRVQQSYDKFIEISQTQKIYGLHTHYGFNVIDTVPEANWLEHQKLLLDYLCVGIGEPLPETTVRRALQLQVQKLGQGKSAIHPETFVALDRFSKEGVMPSVPRYGSLGASGDLITMAHAVRPFFSKNGIKGPRDVISCVNTNSMMSAFALELLPLVKDIIADASEITALNVSGSASSNEPYSESLLSSGANSRYTGQISDLMLESLSKYSNHQSNPLLQQRYSLRCAPQVLAHCLKEYSEANIRIMDEAISLADNPILPTNDNMIKHGGLFYAIGIASAADRLTEVCYRICEMIDRQVLLMMDPSTNGGLSANLSYENGTHLKGIHQLVSSLMQRVRGLAQPSRSFSFSCESNNQDIVPCGMTALIQLEELIGCTQEIIKAGYFVGLRAELLQQSSVIPPELFVGNWEKTNTHLLKELVFNLKIQTSTKNKTNKGDNYEFR